MNYFGEDDTPPGDFLSEFRHPLYAQRRAERARRQLELHQTQVASCGDMPAGSSFWNPGDRMEPIFSPLWSGWHWRCVNGQWHRVTGSYNPSTGDMSA